MEQKTNEMYITMRVNGRTHVVRQFNRRKYRTKQYPGGMETVYTPAPNYLGTGMALCGVLRYGQTLEEWVSEKKKRKKSYLN